MWWLLTAHFIFDWGLQNRWMAENKSRWYEVLLAHCMIYTGGISIALEYTNSFAWWKLIFIFIGHYIIDLNSSRASLSARENPQDMQKILWADHLLHFFQLIVISL